MNSSRRSSVPICALSVGRLDKEGVRCSFTHAGEVIVPVTSAERYEKTWFINGSIPDRHTEAGRRLRSLAYSDERDVALFKTLRRRPAAVPVVAAVSPAGEVDAPCARARARSPQSRQGWAVLFERPSQLEGTSCVRACFTRAGGTTHQSCTTPMSYCFRLDVRSLSTDAAPALRSSPAWMFESLIIMFGKTCSRRCSSQA